MIQRLRAIPAGFLFPIFVLFACTTVLQAQPRTPPPFAPPVIPDQVITTVDCASDNLQSALNTPARRLVVNIQGTCPGGVEIASREEVVLQGATPGSGLSGSSTVFTDALSADNVGKLSLSNLTIRGASGSGVRISNVGRASITNCHIESNNGSGLTVSGGSLSVGFTTFADNRAVGIVLENTDAVTSAMNITGAADGLICATGCKILVQNGEITSTASTAIDAFFGGQVNTNSNVVINGNVRVLWKSVLNLAATQVTGSFIEASEDSLLYIQGVGTVVNADLRISDFSQLRVFLAAPLVNGNAVCSAGSLAVCTDPSRITGTINGCGDGCKKP